MVASEAVIALSFPRSQLRGGSAAQHRRTTPRRHAAHLRALGAVAASWALSLAGCGGGGTPERPDAGSDLECVPSISFERVDAGGGSSADGGGGGDAGATGRGGPAGGSDGGSPMMDAGGGPPGMDAGSTGGDESLGCAADEVCLPPGRCYAKCDPATDQPCSPGEMCNAMGACVPRTEPIPDGGGPDVATDPCETADCGGDLCRVVAGEAACVECLTADDCVDAAPVCDIARGQCVPPMDAPCAPCNENSQCATTGTCEMRTEFGEEQVCLAVPGGDAGMACPTGLVVDDDSGLCAPEVGSCTGWRSALEGRECSSDSDCVPLGADGTGTCALPPLPDGGAPDGGLTSTCRQPCIPPAGACPPGTSCNATAEFCLVM